jgi:ABC-type multidrug transport system fused ATPase/permease subunit
MRKVLTTSQRPFYTLYAVQRWLALVLDLVIAGLAIIFAGIAVAVQGSLSTALVALALVNIISLTGNVKLLVTQWALLETSLGAVARIRAYETITPSEVKSGEDSEVPDSWPRQGKVAIVRASTRYS